jgi:demethylmenaquinone methyltransferase / 2-methoxy-6-polyprenyl-1,4-benzoquinol methylase
VTVRHRPRCQGGSQRREIRTPTDASYLRDLFNNSARYYESVNMVTSLGQVVLWRREVIEAARLHPDDRVLDAFCGPGGLAERALPRLGREGRLVLADLSPVMLQQARLRLAERANRMVSPPRIEYVAGDLVRGDLGLSDFDVVLLGWGLRYVDDVGAVLNRVRSFLRPGGRMVVLEFTRPPRLSWATPAHYYFRHILPVVGSWLARDRELHEYLSVSAAKFPSAAELARTAQGAGFEILSCVSHLDGLVTILAATAADTTAPTPSEHAEPGAGRAS